MRRGLRASARGLFVVGLVCASWLPAGAGMLTTVDSGDWSDPSIWGGTVPSADDTAVIAAGHQVSFGESPDSEDECTRLEIEAGAALTFGPGASEFNVGGLAWHVPGGIDVRGTLEIPAGVTVTIDPEGNDTYVEDGLTVRAGGRLVVRGSVLQEGSVENVLEDDAGAEIVVSLNQAPPPDLDLTRARWVWRSGSRKGRWYEILDVAGSLVTLDRDSRSNEQRRGEPDHGAGLAAVSGAHVTGVGVDWTQALAAGSWWWCAADGPAAAVRVRRVESSTALHLAAPYAGSGCSDPAVYVIRDENQPYPAVDLPERAEPGDAFRIILPAVVRSRHGSDTEFGEQTFVHVLEGTYEFENASFESVGNETWASGEGSGVLIRGHDGGSDPGGLFDTVEIYRYGGDAGLEWEDSTAFDVDWLFLHWSHPQITTANEGHGLKFEHTDAAHTFRDVRVRHARFDRTNDDFVWWSTSTAGASGVYDSIGKYCPMVSTGHSCEAVDTMDEQGSNGGQLRIERNLFSNIGSDHGANCLQAAVAMPSGQRGWSGDGWVALDNVCLNIQSGGCITVEGAVRAWNTESIHAVNNVCAAISGNGAKGIPRMFQNQILDFGLRRISGTDGLRGVYEARGNVVRDAARESGDTFTTRIVAVGSSLEDEAHWSGTSWSATDNVLIVSGSGLRVSAWSSPEHPASGQASFSHNVVAANAFTSGDQGILGMVDIHDAPQVDSVTVADNIFFGLDQPASAAGTGAAQAAGDIIDSNVLDQVNQPAWTGVLSAVNDQALVTGLDPAADGFELAPGAEAWNADTTDGAPPGPRFAGTLAGRLPVELPWLVPSVDPEDDDLDLDGDGLIDRWDNCPQLANIGWTDTDSDGDGDRCEDDDDGDGIDDGTDNCPLIANPPQADADSDGAGDSCDLCPLDPDNDGDADGFCVGQDNCPQDTNPSQDDADSDGAGDLCDPCPFDPDDDGDGDGVCTIQDNCPTLPNPNQADIDGDGIGDLCDACALDPDNDGDADGLCADQDNCPDAHNPDQKDSDLDGSGDPCDNCPLTHNASQSDLDEDGIGDLCDSCPENANPSQEDLDTDGCGDACDPMQFTAFFVPDALNLLSLGETVTIELRFGKIIVATDVDPTQETLLVINGSRPLKEQGREISDDRLIQRYSRALVFDNADPGRLNAFTVSGLLESGCPFEAPGEVLVVHEGQTHAAPEDHSSILDDAIRGDLGQLRAQFPGDLGDVTCLPAYRSNYSFTSNNDPDTPPPGDCYFYLYEFCAGTPDCSYGQASTGTERLPASGDCP